MALVTQTNYKGQKRTDGLSGHLSFEQDNNRIIGRDGNSTPRLLILANGSQFRMKISKEGFDALTATGDQLVLDSDNNLFKIVDTGTFSFVPSDFLDSGNAYLTKLAGYTINHPSGVENPIVWVFIEDALGRRTPLPYQVYNYDNGSLSYISMQYMDTYTTTVEVRSVAPLYPGVQFRYYILQETVKATV